ncbi:glycosyl transferase [Bradyrhizobium sp. CCBAU 051011]|uniref:glycosyltransferase family 4 protein n=1 Tax=Bradyrhizobium sp. CCBAU 051011 TaxID=858422 RepID=UPI0013742877|nr:glycosyltransferase family 1 protein [Bradyrhizobium sp. CCBAU 051011]QHO78255.1 glycosyl transferase [Bradyrhizobium sp. CCBAU 051011]
MTARGPFRVAFTIIPRRLWAGGYNYQSNLFAALNRYRQGEIAPVVFAGEQDDAADLEALARIPGVEISQSAAFDRRRAGFAAALSLGLDYAAVAEFRERKVDVVFESARFFGWRLPYPAVAWFPDFQHRRLPQLFSPAARWQREFGFRVQIASGRTIMLSSKSALRDCQKLYPGVAHRTSVVRFATQPPPDLLTANPSDVIEHYGLPLKFFYLPNQFWRHKNHQVVVDALAILVNRGDDVVVAASGSKHDAREPQYFDMIMSQVVGRGLEKNFRYLGMVPLPHVYALLRAATALINPSRFEGWSTTVEEAKSFGVPMILSNIDVHREQTDGKASYFGIDDPLSLANHLAKVSQNPEPALIRNLLPDVSARVAAFASHFVGTVQRATQRYRPTT